MIFFFFTGHRDKINKRRLPAEKRVQPLSRGRPTGRNSVSVESHTFN